MALQIAAQLSVCLPHSICRTSDIDFEKMMFCIPLYFQITENASASLAGAHLFPAVGGNAVGALLSGLIIKRSVLCPNLLAFTYFTIQNGQIQGLSGCGSFDSGNMLCPSHPPLAR